MPLPIPKPVIPKTNNIPDNEGIASPKIKHRKLPI